jgi:hypothetical protein
LSSSSEEEHGSAGVSPRDQTTAGVRFALLGMPVRAREGESIVDVTTSATENAVFLHNLAQTLHSASAGKHKSMESNAGLAEELSRLGEASRKKGAAGGIKALTRGSAFKKYDSLPKAFTDSIVALHKAGVLAALEFRTVRKLLEMDPVAWSAAALARATEAADQNAARRKKLKEEEDARRKKLKEEEDARCAQLAQVVETARSSNKVPGEVEPDLNKLDDLLQSFAKRCMAKLDEWPEHLDWPIVHGTSRSAIARRSLARSVFTEVAKLAYMPSPPTTVNGAFLTGPKGTGKSYLIMQLAKIAIEEMGSDCPFRVSAMYVSGQAAADVFDEDPTDRGRLWRDIVGYNLARIGATMHAGTESAPEAGAEGDKPTSFTSTRVCDWNFANREVNQAKLRRKKLPETKHSPERLVLIIDEFDWWYRTPKGGAAMTDDVLHLLERNPEVFVYLTGSPAYAAMLLYEPTRLLRMLPYIEAKLPAVRGAAPFNDTKLIQQARLTIFDGQAALEFAFMRGKPGLHRGAIAAIEAEFRGFFDAERSHIGLAALARDTKWEALAAEFDSARPTAREMLSDGSSNDGRHPDERGAHSDKTWLKAVMDRHSQSAWTYAGTNKWARIALVGLAMFGDADRLVTGNEIAEAAQLAPGIQHDPELQAMAEEAAQGGDEAVNLDRELCQACDLGILEEGSHRQYKFQSPSHYAGAFMHYLEQPNFGWSRLALLAVMENSAGQWGIAVEALIAQALIGEKIAVFLQVVASHGISSAYPAGTAPPTTDELDAVFSAKFVDGGKTILGSRPESIAAHDPGTGAPVTSKSRPSSASGDAGRGAVEGELYKPIPDKHGADAMAHALQRASGIRTEANTGTTLPKRHNLYIQFKSGLTNAYVSELQKILTKSLVGCVRLRSEQAKQLKVAGKTEDSVTPILALAGAAEVITHNILVITRPVPSMAKAREHFDEARDSEAETVVLLDGQKEDEVLPLVAFKLGIDYTKDDERKRFKVLHASSITANTLEEACKQPEWKAEAWSKVHLVFGGAHETICPAIAGPEALVQLDGVIKSTSLDAHVQAHVRP